MIALDEWLILAIKVGFQWGNFNTNSSTVTMPVSYSNTWYKVHTSPVQAGLTIVVILIRSVKSFTITQHDINAAFPHDYIFTALGI